jgi:polyisoprenoid-binding protein YceI
MSNKTNWAIDTAHSEIHFKVKHMMVSTVTGAFNKFEGSLVTERDDFEGASISFSADVNSINTNNEARDGHLKSDDFFNAAEFPAITFQSSGFSKKSDDQYVLTGHLTIRDVTREVTLAVTYNGTILDPYGNTKAGFEIGGKVSRKEFGLKWNAVTEAGGVVVGDDIQLSLNVQLAKAN